MRHTNALTDKQFIFIRDLLRTRDLTKGGKPELARLTPHSPEYDAMIDTMVERQLPYITRKTASRWIEKLLELPKLTKTAAQTAAVAAQESDVPAGRYAIPTPHAANEHSFFKVSRPTEGKWAGRVFVDQQISDDFQPVRNAAARQAVLETIYTKGIEQSMLLYGQLLGQCGHCGRTLTNDESRERGIGPVCAGRMDF